MSPQASSIFRWKTPSVLPGFGLALGVTRNLSSPQVLIDAVAHALLPSTRTQAWEAVHQQLMPPPAAPANVLEHLERLTASRG